MAEADSSTDGQPLPTGCYHPRYWPTWLGLGCLWLLVQLPWRVQQALGKGLGLLMFHTLHQRRHVCCVNLELAFPELTPGQRQRLNRQHFLSLGQGLLETALSWWGREARLRPRTRIEGMAHLDAARQRGGVVLLSAHFTSLELGGRLLAPHLPLHVVYRPHQNPVIEWLVARLRARRYGKAIPRHSIRTMLQSLKQQQVVWYAQDQHFSKKNSLFAPFFGVAAATNTATSRIAGLGQARVVPFFTLRTPDGYLLRFLPELDAFPGEDLLQDTTRINQLIEQQVRAFPAQYLWTHRRFKTAPDGRNRYTNHQRDNPDSRC
ncbi:MAG: LpxL/LpxP family Kdo(2)-lipid IV(A) lauroyl/palmitoleoyl acyltransferase [Thiothrix sp.]|nr:LpxL/LpxP family Kdo(2)-lipid IV(A) lauroyl/palmitoleoyl acyltransferase [Thiothrix sp.]HPQ95786.1 LpxL/LpxP family Kdo(2)-lipid IV(A) lauroyl/palmitoleoyl acyltransferase [Thiolinea sp.]